MDFFISYRLARDTGLTADTIAQPVSTRSQSALAVLRLEKAGSLTLAL